MIKTISVIGAGTMGNGIAHVFAQNGFKVNLIDVSQAQLTKAMETIRKNLERQLSKGNITEEVRDTTIGNIQITPDLSQGVKQSDLVVEAATENVDLKLNIFRQMDEHAPANCIL